jgi:hypothetical protein
MAEHEGEPLTQWTNKPPKPPSWRKPLGSPTDKPEQQRVTMTPDAMAAIKVLAASESLDPWQRLTAVMLLVWGFAWYDKQPRIDPTLLALPSAQWQEICGYLTSGAPGDPIDRVNLGLAWMNSGPSAYED